MDSFYESTPEPVLRFGDVVRGFHIATPQIDNPSGGPQEDWAIEIAKPAYLVVMTPCCSIEKKSIAVAPLREIRPAFLNNEYFAEDLTRINRKVPPEKSVPRDVWERQLPPVRKQALLAVGLNYTFRDCFVYAPHDLLPKYELPRRRQDGDPVDMGHYMVDFKTIYRVQCDKINRDGPAPPGTKVLQLKVAPRQDMREKLSLYFGRVPEEDEV